MERNRGWGEKEKELEEGGGGDERGREKKREEERAKGTALPKRWLLAAYPRGTPLGYLLGGSWRKGPDPRGPSHGAGSVVGTGEKGIGKVTCFLEKKQHSRMILTPLPTSTLSLPHLPILAPCPHLTFSLLLSVLEVQLPQVPIKSQPSWGEWQGIQRPQ